MFFSLQCLNFQHIGKGVKDDVLNSFCWMYSTFDIPESFTGSCARKEQDQTALYNTYYQVNQRQSFTNLGNQILFVMF